MIAPPLFGRQRRGAALLTVIACSVVPVVEAQRTAPAPAPAVGAARSSWLWVTTAEQGWDSNVRYVSADDADLLSRLNSALVVSRQSMRGSLAVNLGGSAVRYTELTQLDTYTYDLSVEGTRRLTALTSGTASVMHSTRLSTDIVGGAQLPLLALALQRATGGKVSGEHRFSSATTGLAEAGYMYVSFDTPLLVPGGAFTAKLQTTHRYTSRDAVLLVGELQTGRANGLPLSSQALSAGWEPQLGTMRLRIIAGATRLSAGGPSKVIPTGIAEARDSVGKGVLAATARRAVAQAFGLGQLLTTNEGNISYDFQARRGNFLTLGASIAESRVSSGVGVPFRSSAATADIRRVLRSGVTIGAGAAWRQREDVTKASGLAAQVQFGYALSSR